MSEATKKATKSRGSIESTLNAIVAHPTRVAAYVVLNERVASPNEIAAETGLNLRLVSYHVRQLQKFNVIELVDTRQVRGATEHFYRATARPFASDEDWAEMSPEQRDALTRYTLQLIFANVHQALEAGTFDSTLYRCLLRVPLALDEQGYEEMSELEAERYERALEIEANAVRRLAPLSVEERNEATIPTLSVTMVFPTPRQLRTPRTDAE
ncbi:MAG TPA: ArsR family transcriptional regulator [Solirubrobacterales bacterium]|nr:ArsR family transcriptional regulator [Solirubrobacterales bacterium]